MNPPPAWREWEQRLLAEQLARMRGMLYAYSALFFARIRDWTIVTLALLLLGASGLVEAAFAVVPFLVPFAFLETGYLYWYTLFARRHAARLEQAINEAAGHEVLAAHRLEEAFFTPLDAPKLAAFSFARPVGYPSLMTVGYALGAGLLWAAGLLGTIELAADATGVATLLPAAAALWTLGIVAALAWLFLGRRDEDRLAAELDRAYRRDPDR